MTRYSSVGADEVSGEIESNEGLLLVQFGSVLASGSDLLRKRAESLESLAEAGITILDVEVSVEDGRVIREFSLEGLPTLVLYKGHNEVERWERGLEDEEFSELINFILSFYL